MIQYLCNECGEAYTSPAPLDKAVELCRDEFGEDPTDEGSDYVLVCLLCYDTIMSKWKAMQH